MIKQKTTSAEIGIFMPIFNLGAYIEDALKSLECQTFKNFKVILADDHSTDEKTIKKLQSLKLPKNYELFFENKNMGLNKLANKYSQLFDTKYFMIFSPDDMLKPTYLEECVTFLKQNKKYAAVSTWLEYFDLGSGIRKYNSAKTDLKNMLLTNEFCGSALIRKSAWEEVDGYDSNDSFKVHQDYDLWLSLLERNYKLGIIPKPLFIYRIRKKSLSRKFVAKVEEEWITSLVKKHEKAFSKHIVNVLTKKHLDYESLNSGWNNLNEEHKKLSALYLEELAKRERAEIMLLKAENKQSKYYKLSLYRIFNLFKKNK